MNYDIEVQPLEYIYIDNTQLYDKDDNRLSKPTQIDMSIVGMHIENQLLGTLKDEYLSQVCEYVG